MKKSYWIIPLAVFFGTFIVFNYLLKLGSEVSIQASLMIGLIFITALYAFQTRALVEQTHELVEQEKNNLIETIKKRNIDFLERKINEFYVPFSKILHSVSIEFSAEEINNKNVEEIRIELFYLYRGKSHLVSKDIIEKIDKFEMFLFMAVTAKYRDSSSYQKYSEAQEEVDKIIRKDWDEAIDILRNFYGIKRGA